MADAQQWVGTVAVPVIALATTALVEIGTWRARSRRELKSDLEIVHDLPEGRERDALRRSIVRRTQELVIRTNRPRFVDWLGMTRRRFAFTLLSLLAVLAGMAYLTHVAVKSGGQASARLSVASSAADFDAATKALDHARLVLDLNWIALVMVTTLGVVFAVHVERFQRLNLQREVDFPAGGSADTQPSSRLKLRRSRWRRLRDAW